MMDDKELDDILDGALDAFEKLEVKKEEITTLSTQQSLKPQDKKVMDDFEREMAKVLDLPLNS